MRERWKQPCISIQEKPTPNAPYQLQKAERGHLPQLCEGWSFPMWNVGVREAEGKGRAQGRKTKTMDPAEIAEKAVGVLSNFAYVTVANW